MTHFEAFDSHLQISQALERGLRTWGKPPPVSLDEWARQNFHLSSESSYIEQAWNPWPFQRGIMHALSRDDIAEVTIKKSARVGIQKCCSRSCFTQRTIGGAIRRFGFPAMATRKNLSKPS